MRGKIDIENYCLENGVKYEPMSCPPNVKRGKVGKCFDTSLLNVLLNKNLFYVEGIAFSIIDKCWVHHAWLTDEKGKVCYDPTWCLQNKKTKEIKVYQSAYYGIKMDTQTLINFVQSTHYNSVFVHGWRNKEILDKLLKNHEKYTQ